jgi:hypothetical protein
VQSIPDFVAGKQTQKRNPLALADLIDQDVDAAAAGVKAFGKVHDQELRLTLDDINIICEMGRYYADKIRGSAYVARARASKTQADKTLAVTALSQASEHYNTYVSLVAANHVNQIWLSRVGTVNFEKQKADVLADIDVAKSIVVQ